MFTSFHMPVKLSKYTTTHPNIKMQQKMLLQFSASSLSATFLCLALVMVSLFLAIGGTIVAGTYMQMPNMNNCNI